MPRRLPGRVIGIALAALMLSALPQRRRVLEARPSGPPARSVRSRICSIRSSSRSLPSDRRSCGASGVARTARARPPAPPAHERMGSAGVAGLDSHRARAPSRHFTSRLPQTSWSTIPRARIRASTRSFSPRFRSPRSATTWWRCGTMAPAISATRASWASATRSTVEPPGWMAARLPPRTSEPGPAIPRLPSTRRPASSTSRASATCPMR
jgi:hypothetical protein